MSKTLFRESGNTFYLTNDKDLVIHENLPPGIYTLMNDPVKGFYLEKDSESFSLPEKLYGDVNSRAERILSNFLMGYQPNLGVLLTGSQGSGKTLLAKRVSNLLIEKNYPVIKITSPYHSDAFKSFIYSLGVCVILFEEFEKVYEEKWKQQNLLTLLDGVYDSKKLWLLTVNTEYNLIEQLSNRSSRIYYRFTYDRLDINVLTEYCNDNLQNKKHFEKILLTYKFFGSSFNFDMLQALVNELNHFPDDSVSDVVSILNFKNLNSDRYEIKSVTLEDGTGTPITGWREHKFIYLFNKNKNEIIVSIPNGPNNIWLYFGVDQLTNFDYTTNTATFTVYKTVDLEEDEENDVNALLEGKELVIKIVATPEVKSPVLSINQLLS